MRELQRPSGLAELCKSGPGDVLLRAEAAGAEVEMEDTSHVRELAAEFERAMWGGGTVLERHRQFVRLVVSLSAGGPPATDLVHAIEQGTLEPEAVAHLLYGLPFSSYTDPPGESAL